MKSVSFKKHMNFLLSGSALLLLNMFFVSVSLLKAQEQEGEKQDRIIQVNVDSSIEPSAAVGLFISANGPIELAAPFEEMQKTADNKLIVSIHYKEDQVPRDSMATAIVFSEQGEIAMANLRPVFAPEPKDSFMLIPDCAPEKINEAALASQTSLLESLIDVRKERRRVAQLAVAKALSGDLLVRLQKLEGSFGLEHEPQLSPEMPPVMLIDRLTRILEAIRSYETTK